MPVVGTYKDSGAFNLFRRRKMVEATVEESLDKIQELVKKKTPKGETGALRASILKTSPNRTARRIWTGKVYSNLEYAAAIEYGMSPQVITPKRKEVLRFFWGKTGQIEYFKSVNWPGYQGAHMFQLAAAEFDQRHAEDIAESNARQWLGALDAGRRTFTI